MDNYFKKPYRIIMFIPVSLYAGYSFMTESGLYLMIAELQVEWFGRYYVAITGFMTVLVISTPLYLLDFILVKLFSRKGQEVEASSNKPQIPLSKKFRLYASVFFGLAVLSAAGAYFSAPLVKIFFKQEKLTVLSLNDLNKPKSLYVQMTGHQKKQYTIILSTDHSKKYFTPLTGSRWNISKPVTFFIKKRAGHDYATDKYELSKNSLPGMVKARFNKLGLKVSSPHYTAQPVFRATNAMDVIIYFRLGGFLLAVFFLIVSIPLFFKSLSKREKH